MRLLVMSKINKGYQSLFEYIVIKDLPFSRKLDEKFYPYEHSTLKRSSDVPYSRRWNPQPHRWQQLLGGLQPIADMGKDVVDTFKPYKSFYYAKRDFLQPIRGLVNIARGIGILVGAPMIFLGNMVRYTFFSHSFSGFASNTALNFHRTASWLLDGASSLFRAATQIATTPLTWFLKMPLRGLITAIKGRQSIQQTSSVKKLVAQGKEAVEAAKRTSLASIDDKCVSSADAVEHLDAIRYQLHRKYKKALKRDQKTNISQKKEKELFNGLCFKHGRDYVNSLREGRAIAALQYIGLFSTVSTEQQESLNAKRVKSTGSTSLNAHQKSLEHTNSLNQCDNIVTATSPLS